MNALPSRTDAATAVQAPPRHYETTITRRSVRVRWTDTRGTHVVEVTGRSVIGSAVDSSIAIDDPAVSRIHAELQLRPDGVWVRDLGSRNGTVIQDIQVVHARVPDQGVVRVGSTLLDVRSDVPPASVELWPTDRYGPLIGRSTVMRELFARLEKIAHTDSTVLIYGETGTGKELVATAIHDASARSDRPFTVVDCGSLPENLLEAELFGHARGAFTGAVAARAGAIEAADGGTVFLDEIGELPLSLQPKLLRVLESRTVRRIGETAYRKVDVRFVSATHRDIRRMVNDGAFREDLYFRLSVIPVIVPPLRERPEDIPLLLESFASPGMSLPASLVQEARRRPWYGNVRELRNFVERVVALGTHEAIALSAAQGGTARPTADGPTWETLSAALDLPLREARATWLDAMEREYVRRLLERYDGDVAEAAGAAGVDRTHLYRLIRKYR
jgi:two-component system response regulator GlrR